MVLGRFQWSTCLKILCRTRLQAIKMYYAVEDFLQTRLHLQISEEKSKVVNLKKNSSEFLGFRIKAHHKKTNKRTLYDCSFTYDQKGTWKCANKGKTSYKGNLETPINGECLAL